MQLTVDNEQLPVGWKVKKLAEVCQIEKSQGIYANLPYVGMENIESNNARFIGSTEPQSVKSSTFKFSPNHILYGRLRPYLNKVLAPDFVGHCSTEIFPIKPSECLNRNFLFYWLLMDSTVKRINATCTGARMPRANMTSVFEFDFPLPSLPEQKRIVAILDEAFEGIDRAIANTEKNLANSRQLFESYLNAIFTQKGNGWEEKKLEDICEVKDGTHDSPKYVESGIPFITQKNIRENGLTFENIKFISLSDHEKFYARSNVSFGDILISMIGANRGMSCIVDTKRICSIKNVGLIKAPKNINRYFLLYFLKSKQAQIYVESASRGGAQPFIGLGKLREFPVSVAPQNSQATIVMKLDELYAKTQRLEAIYRKKIAALNELKQSILQKAFTGELTADTAKSAKEGIAA